jgi:2-aminoadipate transaminase
MTVGTKKYWPKRKSEISHFRMQSTGTLTDRASRVRKVNWDEMFARRTLHMKRTAVRELLKVTARPDIISFAGGLPAAELFPVDRVQQALSTVLERVGGHALQYGETEGLAELREWIAQDFNARMRAQTASSGGSNPPELGMENVLITCGAQQALDLIGRVLLEEGDCVVVENPTYLALLSAWRPTGVEFLPVPSDASGLRTAALHRVLEQSPKLIYVTPNFQNPQGTTLALERRIELLERARHHGVGVVEDNPYGELRYSGETLPHLLELDLKHSDATGSSAVIYTGTFSKVLMPGLRVGWVIAPAAIIEKLVQAKQAADLHTGSLNQYLVLELLREGFLSGFLPVLVRNYRQRRDAMLEALERFFPAEISWTRPEGGMFLMVKLPDSMDAGSLLTHALARGVAYVPGEEFHSAGEGRNTLRLNFSNARPDQIESGIKRLADVFSSF